MPPHRALDVVPEVRHPVGSTHQRRALPRHRIGQPHPVGCPAERDVLSRRRRFLRRFRFCRDGRRVVEHGRDELVSAPAHRPDESLRFAVVAERPPRRLDPAGQGRLADEFPAPYRVEKLFFGDAALVVAYQLGQYVEHLRFDTNDLVTVTQFVALGVEDESIEAPQAGGPLSPAVGRLGRPHQSVAQFAKLRVLGALVDCRRDVFGGTSHLVNAVGQFGGLLGGQNDGIRGQCGALDLRPLLVCALPTGLPAVLPAPAETRIGDLPTTPPAGLRASAGSGQGLHGTRP